MAVYKSKNVRKPKGMFKQLPHQIGREGAMFLPGTFGEYHGSDTGWPEKPSVPSGTGKGKK